MKDKTLREILEELLNNKGVPKFLMIDKAEQQIKEWACGRLAKEEKYEHYAMPPNQDWLNGVSCGNNKAIRQSKKNIREE